jgi:hypothetical protein
MTPEEELQEYISRINFTIIPNPLADIKIPDTWNSVLEFGKWWIDQRMPIFVGPKNPEIFLSDDATAVSLFCHGRFQIELYLIHPSPLVPDHEHPGVEVIKVRMGTGSELGLTPTLLDGQVHGAGIRLEAETKGFPLIAVQHWKSMEPCTIAAMWKGPTVGPKQEALIRRFHPDAYVVDGYADITRKITDV